MAGGNFISCAQYAAYLVNQTPRYDKEITRDVRVFEAELAGYYKTMPFDAYDGVTHRFDRFRHVGPDTTKVWNTASDTACTGTPCDPPENEIGWGWDRTEYTLEKQSWATRVICFDDVMTKTAAKEHTAQIIQDILRPAAVRITSSLLLRKAAELAGKKTCVRSGMPDFTFTWDPGSYKFMTVNQEPTAILEPNMLRKQVARLTYEGGTKAGKNELGKLEFHTDADSYYTLTKGNSTLTQAWRITDFDAASEMYWKYGFQGMVGDFLVKCLQYPMRFNKVSSTRFQQILPYTPTAAGEGIKSDYNEDYEKAQFQFSLINNPGALVVKPFSAEAVNPNMPYLVRDFGGKWKFSTNDLGADANGRAIANYRQNKGKFWADWMLAVKPEHPEWLTLMFHMRDTPCITYNAVCNDYPGYPAQTYDGDSGECACASSMTFTAEANHEGQFELDANTIEVNGAAITQAAVITATVANLVTALAARWSTASLDGTWALIDETARTFKITWSAANTPQNSIVLPFTT